MSSPREVLCIFSVLGVSILGSMALYAQSADGNEKSTQVYTGMYGGRLVRYHVVRGLAIAEGDIILGKVEQLESGSPPASTRKLARRDAVANGGGLSLWPPVGAVFQVPYVFTRPIPPTQAEIDAIKAFNDTFNGTMRFAPRTTEADYVEFDLDPADTSGGCYATIGRAGGAQKIAGSAECPVTVLLHEMGHAVGLFHEQTRADRDQYVTLLPQNITKSRLSAYAQSLDSQDVGLYDYASTMHYGTGTYARGSEPTMVTIPPGIAISEGGGYSDGDIDNIKRLYGLAPRQVVITSNPRGLQVLVDGAPITTPQSFNWELNSSHTLSVPDGAQTLNGVTYIYGRWNDIGPDQPASHGIVVRPGDGSRISPASSPAVTVYAANFVRLVPFSNLTVSPDGGGTVTTDPAPIAVPGSPALYFALGQKVTFRAQPAPGFNFYDWRPTGTYGCGLSFHSPVTEFRVPSWPMNLTARFTQTPVTTITTNPPGLPLTIDGIPYSSCLNPTPRNFASEFNPGWTPGSSHNVTADSGPRTSGDTRHFFVSWSDGGQASHAITLPAANSTVTAGFRMQHKVSATSQTACAGQVTVDPVSADGFYNVGTPLNLTASPSAGFQFSGWLQDLSGRNSPATINVNDETDIQASFNTVGDPIRITALSPSSVIQNGPAFTLTIYGTGFSEGSIVCFFDAGSYQSKACLYATFVSSNQLTLNMTMGLINQAGRLGLTLYSAAAGATQCSARAYAVLPVVQPASTLGNNVASRAYTDSASGTIYAYAGSFPAAGQVVTSWSFFGKGGTCCTNPSGRFVTPLILAKVSATVWRITGIGTVRENNYSGLQTFDFGLVDGSALVGANSTFGWWDGTTAGNVPNVGAIHWDDPGPAGPGVEWLGEGWGGGSPGPTVGNLYRTFGRYNRDYSVQFKTGRF